MHIAGDPPPAHLGDQLQGLAQLLVASALADHGGVGVHVAQGCQLVPLRQRTQPVKQLRRPAQRRCLVLRSLMAGLAQNFAYAG